MFDPDPAIAASLNGSSVPGYAGFFSAVTLAGNAYVWLVVLIVAILLGKWRSLAAVLVVVLLFSMVINDDLKGIVDRARPGGVVVPGYFALHSSSFPSGHTQTAFVVAAFLSAFILRRYSLITFLLAAAVGMSRLYLGYHYFTDVVGGAAVGVIIGLLAIYILRRLGLLDNLSRSPGAGHVREMSGATVITYAFIVLVAGFAIALGARLLSSYLLSLFVIALTYVAIWLLPALSAPGPSEALYRPR